jgi:K+-sensing histidine kinase KdpD
VPLGNEALLRLAQSGGEVGVPRTHTLNGWHSTSGAITTPRLWWLRGIALSTLIVACALIPRLWLHGVLEDRSTFILFTLAVMVCARFGGVFAGAIATGLSILAGIIVFLGPAHDEAERLADIIEILLFAVVGLGITWLAQQLRSARLRAEEALEQVRTLTGLLPICAWCKKIRDEEGRWQQLERYLSLHSDAKFTHGLCEDCGRRMEADRQALKGASSSQFHQTH